MSTTHRQSSSSSISTTTNSTRQQRGSLLWRKVASLNCSNKCGGSSGSNATGLKMTSLVSSRHLVVSTSPPDLDDVSYGSSRGGSSAYSYSSGEYSGSASGSSTRQSRTSSRHRRGERQSQSQPRRRRTAAVDANGNRKATSKATSTTSAEVVAVSPFPPFHTCILILGLVVFFLRNLPTMKSLDEIATLETFTHVNYPEFFSLGGIITIRLLLAAIMLGNTCHVFLWGKWEADTQYLPGSRLREVSSIPFRGALMSPPGSSAFHCLFNGFKCISSFTVWCWILEGTAFLLAGIIPLLGHANNNPWLLRLTIVLWETAAPITLLVSSVVKFALWPMALERGGENSKLLKSTGALLQHNLNSIAALLEVGLLGGLPVRFDDFVFPPLFGIVYLLFNYAMMYSWVPKNHHHSNNNNSNNKTAPGPQYFYPFFDTTLGITTSLCLCGLLVVLSISFVVFCGANSLLKEAPDSKGAVPTAAILLLSIGVCRFWD